jgi:PhnB protein
MSTVNAIPSGHRTVTPYLAIKNAAKALEFYKKAFGATESYKLMMPDERLGHAEIRLGDSMIMLSDEFPEYGGKAPETLGGSPVSIHLYVEDVDAFFKRALAAGAKELKPVMDQFYGDRSGQLEDLSGISGGWPRIKKTLRRRRCRNACRPCSRGKSKSVSSREAAEAPARS